MKKTAPKKSPKTVKEEKVVTPAADAPEPVSTPTSISEPVSAPSEPVSSPTPSTSPSSEPPAPESKKKEPEVEVIADYSGTQPQAASSPVESSEAPSAEPSTEEDPKTTEEPSESKPEEPRPEGSEETASESSDEAKDATAPKEKDEPEKEVKKTPEVPSISKDAPLKIEKAEQNSDEEEEPKIEKSNKKLFIIGIIITIAVIVTTAIFGFYFLKQDAKEESVKEEKAETTPTPTSKPKTSLDRSEWSLEVLNGTATPGLAKELADKLEKLGYTIVESGNADKSSYEISEIYVSDDKTSEEIELLLVDIKKEIDISSSSGDLSEGTASARIIIGSDYNSGN